MIVALFLPKKLFCPLSGLKLVISFHKCPSVVKHLVLTGLLIKFGEVVKVDDHLRKKIVNRP